MFENKELYVWLDEHVQELINELKEKRYSDKSSRIIYDSFVRAIELLSENPHAGIKIPKRLIPDLYITRFGARNLWKINLANFWRLIYWIDGDEVKVISMVVDVIDHKKYNKIFNY